MVEQHKRPRGDDEEHRHHKGVYYDEDEEEIINIRALTTTTTTTTSPAPLAETPLSSPLLVSEQDELEERADPRSLASIRPEEAMSSSSPQFKSEAAGAVEAILANQLHQLSLLERERVYEEIHGVDEALPETPERTRHAHAELLREIAAIPHKPAYDRAVAHNAGYTRGRAFCHKFLRAENWDPPKAAARMVYFCEKIAELFGASALGRPLCYDDLDADDQKCLRAGHVQILPKRDRSGRMVFGDFQNMFPRCYKNSRNMLRAMIYTILSALDEDEELQRRGFVVLDYHLGELRMDMDRFMIEETPRVTKWLPIKVAVIHMCMDNPVFKIIARLLLLGSTTGLRSRVRLHEGTTTEIRYQLMTFGIPLDAIPLTSQGELKLLNHHKWIAKQRAKERFLRDALAAGIAAPEFGKIDVPGRYDVLLAQGKPYQQHSGNVHLRALIDQERTAYSASNKRAHKAEVVRRVMDAILTRGGRYLKKDPNDDWWVPISDKEARERTVKAFTAPQASSSSSRSATKPKTDDDSPEHKRARKGLDLSSPQATWSWAPRVFGGACDSP